MRIIVDLPDSGEVKFFDRMQRPREQRNDVENANDAEIVHENQIKVVLEDHAEEI